jgi:hypothetical protein
MDPTWPGTPTSAAPYRYTEEPRQYSPYANGVAPRPVAPAVKSPQGARAC